MTKEKTFRRKHPTVNGEELMQHAISTFRRISGLSGPPDRLQTREFRTSCEIIKAIDSWIDTPLEKEGEETSRPIPALLDDRYSRTAALNYILYYWPLHVFESVSLLSELPYAPKRVLDIGSGPGSYAFGALLHGASDVTLFDHSQLFLDMASELIGRWGFTAKREKGLWPRKPLPQGPFDLITIGHSLNEIASGSQEKALNLIENALHRLDENGFLIISLSSKEPHNKTILLLREALSKKGYEIQAPCIWQGACPALLSSSPCYAQRKWEKPFVMKEIQRGADIFLNSLKMSYLVIRSPLMKKRELVQDPLYRVISPPIDMMGQKRFFLCGTAGKKHMGCRLPTTEEELPKNLKAFSFLERGSLITVGHHIEKNEAIDLVTDSNIQLVAPPDRPVPEKVVQDEEVSSK